LPGGGLNIAHEAVERHAHGPRADHVAIRWHPAAGPVRPITFRELSEASSRFANVLRSLGVGRGDAVFVLCGRIPELYFAVLAGLRLGAAVSPLFSAFGPEPIATRVNLGRGKVLVTTESLFQKKVTKIAVPMPTLQHVLRVDSPDFRAMFDSASPACEVAATLPEDTSFLHFTARW
jgi:acetyl-CoA synthetase